MTQIVKTIYNTVQNDTNKWNQHNSSVAINFQLNFRFHILCNFGICFDAWKKDTFNSADFSFAICCNIDSFHVSKCAQKQKIKQNK